MVEVPADNVPLFVNDNRFYVYEAVGLMFGMPCSMRLSHRLMMCVRQAVNYAVNKDNIRNTFFRILW